MKTVLAFGIVIWAISIGSDGARERNIQITGVDSLPYGPFYCQARCLASCMEMKLASNLDECSKFCPPFESAMPCPPSNLDCWRNCGIPPTPRDKPPPPAVNFVVAQHVSSSDPRVQDPFTIELSWDPVHSASLYIVELYPLNRQPRPGENNFFRALTSFPTYTVRKEDECTIYDIRVMPVNAFGIGAPQYTRIEAPRPLMTGAENFFVRSIRRDPINDNFVTVNIDYALLAAWPVLDVDLVGIRVKAVECRGMAVSNNGSSSLGLQTDNAWYPFYDFMIEKMPSPKIQLAFLSEVVKSDCLFQMRVGALTTRCNTTTYFDSNGGTIQDSNIGIDFRINCMTAAGFPCMDSNHQPSVSIVPEAPSLPFVPPSASMPIPPPVPTLSKIMNETFSAPIVPPAGATEIQTPQVVPQQFQQPQMPQVPQIPQLPQQAPNPPSQNFQPFAGGMPQQPPGPPSSLAEPSNNPFSNVGTISQNTHPLLIDYLLINSQSIPAICDINTLEVQPYSSVLGTSMIDLAVSWMEKNPGAQRSPSYFVVRYGPIIRALVEDSRRPQKVIAGQESIVRTNTLSQFAQMLQLQPERQIKILGVPKNALLSFQVCAIYDSNIEPLISWEMVQSQHVDLLALQVPAVPSVSEPPPKGPITSLAPLATDESPLSVGLSDNQQVQGGKSTAGGGPSDTVVDNVDNLLGTDGDKADDSGPIVLQVGIVDARPSSTTFWLMFIGGVFLTLLTGIMVFVFIVRMCSKRGSEKKLKSSPYPTIPIAMITKVHQPQVEKEKMAGEKEVEKIALP